MTEWWVRTGCRGDHFIMRRQGTYPSPTGMLQPNPVMHCFKLRTFHAGGVDPGATNIV